MSRGTYASSRRHRQNGCASSVTRYITHHVRPDANRVNMHQESIEQSDLLQYWWSLYSDELEERQIATIIQYASECFYV